MLRLIFETSLRLGKFPGNKTLTNPANEYFISHYLTYCTCVFVYGLAGLGSSCEVELTKGGNDLWMILPPPLIKV